MTLNSKFAVISLALAIGAAAFAVTTSGAAQAPPMPTPKPGPEHELLKMDVGTWDAVIEVTPPGAPPMMSKGVEVNTIGCRGRCLIVDFKGALVPGLPFEGHGVTTWDVTKNAYAGSWTDSMSQGLARTESKWDPAAKRMTGWMEGPDMTGTVTKTRSVVEHRGGTRVFTAFAAGPDGKEAQVLKITYKKRK